MRIPSNKIEKAILLAAGFGTRLRPLTNETPKPLLPINGETLIDHQLSYLAKEGIKEVAINLHHLGEKIRTHVGDGKRYGLKVHYSFEPEILGTGGGVKKAAELLGEPPFILLNSDALISVNFGELSEFYFKNICAAMMVVKKLTKEDKDTPIKLDNDNFIIGFGTGEHFYASVQVIGQKLLDVLPKSGTPACLIKDGYIKLIEANIKVGTFIYSGYFNNIGTLENLEQARKDIKGNVIPAWC